MQVTAKRAVAPIGSVCYRLVDCLHCAGAGVPAIPSRPPTAACSPLRRRTTYGVSAKPQPDLLLAVGAASCHNSACLTRQHIFGQQPVNFWPRQTSGPTNEPFQDWADGPVSPAAQEILVCPIWQHPPERDHYLSMRRESSFMPISENPRDCYERLLPGDAPRRRCLHLGSCWDPAPISRLFVSGSVFPAPVMLIVENQSPSNLRADGNRGFSNVE